MKKNLKKPLKSLMLTAMALLTATATLVNASSYANIRVEHVWEDENNQHNTRPENVKDTIIQIWGDKDRNEAIEEVKKDPSKGYTEFDDTGYEAGQEAVTDKGYQDGVQAAESIKNQENLPEPPEVVEEPKEPERPKSENEPKEPTEPEKPKEPDTKPVEPKKPDVWKVDPDNGSVDSEAYKAAQEAYQKELEAYNKALEEYEKSPEYAKFQEEMTKYETEYSSYETEKTAYEDALKELDEAFKGTEEYAKALEEYKAAKTKYENYLKAEEDYKKAMEALANGQKPENLPEGFGFNQQKFLEGYQAAVEGGYTEAYLEGFWDSVKGSAPETPEVDREQLVAQIKDGLKDKVDKDTAKNIADKIAELLKDTSIGNQWATEEGNKPNSAKEIKDGEECTPEGTPINYDAEILDQNTLDALQNAGKDKGYDGYKTVKMQVKVTLVAGDDGVQRVYVSVDGGTNWTPGDEATAKWDQDNKTTYDPATEYVEETVITFLHTLVKAPEDPKDPKDPKDPETPIPEEEVPLTDVEEEPEEEEIPEEEVPLTDVPKTGDNSLLWMCAAMFSGTALLALLKKEKEAQEA